MAATQFLCHSYCSSFAVECSVTAENSSAVADDWNCFRRSREVLRPPALLPLGSGLRPGGDVENATSANVIRATGFGRRRHLRSRSRYNRNFTWSSSSTGHISCLPPPLPTEKGAEFRPCGSLAPDSPGDRRMRVVQGNPWRGTLARTLSL